MKHLQVVVTVVSALAAFTALVVVLGSHPAEAAIRQPAHLTITYVPASDGSSLLCVASTTGGIWCEPWGDRE